VSPRSRGRPKGRGRSKSVSRSRPVRELRLSDRLLRDAEQIVTVADVSAIEAWASGWFGAAWLEADWERREVERQLCVKSRSAPRASRRVAQPGRGCRSAILSETQPRPPWIDAPGSTAAGAWRAVDVWESERVLFVEYAGPQPHVLMAAINDVGGSFVERLQLLEPGAAHSWAEREEADETPMTMTECEPGDALAELAAALRVTDMTLPVNDDEDFVTLRALAWSRCRTWLPPWPEFEPLSEAESQRILDEFIAAGDLPDDLVTRSLAELFLDYGDGYITARGAGVGSAPPRMAGVAAPGRLRARLEPRRQAGARVRCRRSPRADAAPHRER
jgi:hypothetical protein